MKTLLLLLSLSAVAVGQTTPATSKAVDLVWIVATHKPPCISGEVTATRRHLGKRVTYCQLLSTPAKSDTCDGLACTGPVEMLLAQPKITQSYDGCNTTTYIEGQPASTTLAYCPPKPILLQPDKAAVPVDLSGGDDIQRERIQSVNEPADVAYAVLKCNPGIHSCDMKDAVQIGGINSTVVKLADNEYFHLQQLRAAVVEEEKRLAVKYGAKMPSGCAWLGTPTNGATFCDQIYSAGDHYEFRSQFLLIDKEGR
jgi:hypothetical protein